MPPLASPGAFDDAPTGSPRRRLKITLITLTVLILAGLALTFIWVAHRYQQGVELAKRAQEQYSALNAQYPFNPPQAPPAGQPSAAAPSRVTDPTYGRWTEMLRVRQQVQSQAPPALRQTLQSLLAVRSLGDPAVYRELMAGVPLLGPLLNEQLTALRREQMSAREYQWLLGLAITRAMEAPERYPAGKGYWGVLEKLQQITHADRDPNNDVDAKAVYEFFRKAYSSAGGAPPQALQGLDQPDEAACAIDLLLAAAQWATAEGRSTEGMLHNLLPGKK